MKVLGELKNLRTVLESLEILSRAVDNQHAPDGSGTANLKPLCDPENGILSKCLHEINSIGERLTPPGWIGPDGSRRKALFQSLSWPLKEKETENTLNRIERFKTALNVAMTVDQL